MRIGTLLLEAWKTTWAQRVASVLLAVVSAAMCVSVLATVGSNVAAAERLVDQLDGAGARMMVVNDAQDLGLISNAVVDTVAATDAVEAVVGVDVAFDVVNSGIGDGGEKVAAWPLLGSLSGVAVVDRGRMPLPGEALVSESAAVRLGLDFPAGAVTDAEGFEYPVVGSFRSLDGFEFLDGGVLIAADQPRVSSIQVLASSHEQVATVEQLVMSVIAAPGPEAVSVRSPRSIADLQSELDADMTAYGARMLALVLSGGAVLIAAVVFAETLMRRRELGRRRALGISRTTLTWLTMLRSGIAGVAGSAAGVIYAVVDWAQGEGVPGEFAFALFLATVVTAMLAAFAPAVAAAFQDPVRVLRTA